MDKNIRVNLGNSGLSVSPICYGTWQLSPRFWGTQSEEEIISAIRYAFELGVNFYDTADAYGDGLAETVLGKALKIFPREQIIVATKVYHHFYPDGHRYPDLSQKYIIEACDASLHRLQMDYIDLYQCHAFDPITTIEETTEAMELLKKQGKIRVYGVSNFTTEQVRLARKFGNYATVQPHYDLLDTQIENDLLPYCQTESLGVLIYSSLHRGLLTGKYKGTEKFNDLRTTDPDFQGERFRLLTEHVSNLAPLAEKYGLTIIQLVLTATLMHPAIHSAIVGIKNKKQIEEAAGAIGKSLNREDYWQVRQILF
ncbi:MAG: aldo/keto reductase [Actinobacteria bacterium]|nr:aldo/keto reductase [Actinomycetota bacterium]MCL5408882.1 aldo/keto reductase [Candidatus Omnitrophota bacterium]